MAVSRPFSTFTIFGSELSHASAQFAAAAGSISHVSWQVRLWRESATAARLTVSFVGTLATVTFTEALAPLAVYARTVHCPSESAVRTPLWPMWATRTSLLSHVSSRLRALPGKTYASSVTRSPGGSRTSSGYSITDCTSEGTYTVADAVLPFTAMTVTTAVP